MCVILQPPSFFVDFRIPRHLALIGRLETRSFVRRWDQVFVGVRTDIGQTATFEWLEYVGICWNYGCLMISASFCCARKIARA